MSSDVRRRRRTVEERVGAALRHMRPGDLAGRGEPLPRDGGGRSGRASARPGIDPGGTEIHHVTLGAVAGQTIAAGGAGVEWATIDGSPTERRGFDSLSAQLAADGSVAAIPISLTGVMNWLIDGEWATYRGCASLTVTLWRNAQTVGDPVVYDLGPVTSRFFDGDDDDWEVRAGDTVTYELANDSGSPQTLTRAKLVQRVEGAARSTSDAPVLPTGPYAWWAADDLELADGAAVSSWVDRTGNGRHAEQGTGASQPVYRAEGLNGGPAVEFDGIDDYLAAVNWSTRAQPNTIAVLIQAQDTTSKQTMIGSVSAPQSAGIAIDDVPNDWMFGASFEVQSGVAPDTDIHVLIATFDGASSSLWLDGVKIVTGDVGTESATAATLGADLVSGAVTRPYDGLLAEAIWWDRLLSDTEVRQANAYLRGTV